jgi:hypothetical protein
MKNQMKPGRKYLRVELLTTDNSKLIYYAEKPCEHYVVDTKRGKMLKIAIAGIMDNTLKKSFEATCTFDWVYIPVRFVKSLKEGVSSIRFFAF